MMNLTLKMSQEGTENLQPENEAYRHRGFTEVIPPMQLSTLQL